MMYRKFIAVVLMTAVAVTGFAAAPARADNNDLLKILGGVAAIAIIGSAISKHDERDDYVSRRNPYYGHKPHRPKHHGHGHHGHKHHSHKHRGHKHHGYNYHDHAYGHHGHKHHGHKRRGHKHHGYNYHDHAYGHHGHKHHTKKHHYNYNGNINHQGNQHARPLPPRVQRKVLPASCALQVEDRLGRFPAYRSQCLHNKFKYASRLPGQCVANARFIESNRATRVYRRDCLNRHGYTAARY